MGIKITINGKQKTLSQKMTAQQLLIELGMAEQKLALEINEEIVPRSALAQRIILPGDNVEIIHAIGGG